MTWMAAFGCVGLAGLLCLARLVKGPSVTDRMVALDTLLIVIVTGVGVAAARVGRSVFLDAMVVAALLGFVGTVTVARMIEGRASR